MTTVIKLGDNTELTVEEAEIYCALKMDNAVEKERQRQIALELASIFDSGREDIISNEWKAQQYLAFATKSAKAEKAVLSDDNAFWLLNWFTSIRLALVRSNREADVFAKKPFLPMLFSIGGLSYFVELVIDLYKAVKTALNPRSSLERSLGFSKRLWNALKEDDRPNRMSNALLWFGVNFTCFILTMGVSELAKVTIKLVSSVLNLAGFSVDVMHDAGFAFATYRRHMRVLEKINHKIQLLERKGRYTHNEYAELEHLRKTVKPQLEEKAKAAYSGFLRTSFVTIGLVIGMGLIFFPPTSLVGAVMIGSTMALGIGSGIGGLGRRLWLLSQKPYHSIKNYLFPEPEKNKDELTLKVPNEPRPLIAVSPKIDQPEMLRSSSTTTISQQLSSPEMTTPTTPDDESSLLTISPKNTSPTVFESGARAAKTSERLVLDIRKKIETLDKLADKSKQLPTSGNENSISKVLSVYTPAEIQEIRHLLGLTDDVSWNKQVGYWLQFYVNPETQDYSANQLYKGSFRFALFQRIKEERNLMKYVSDDKAIPELETTKLEIDFENGRETRTLRSVSTA